MKRTPLKRSTKPLKRSKLKKSSRSVIPRLKRALWKLVSLYVRKRGKWKCFTCGKVARGYYMHAGHFITRNNASTLFDPRNLRAQCASCNIYLRGNVAVYAANLIDEIGREEFDRLVKRGREIKQWDEKSLRELIAVLKDGGNYEQEYETIYNKRKS